jgi:TonB family protein
MTFQRSLLLSMAVHFLIFGSAIAFAQYGHVLGRSDTITVMLVGAGQASEKSLRKTSVDSDLEVEHQGKSAHHRDVSRMAAEGSRAISEIAGGSAVDDQVPAKIISGLVEKAAANGKSGGETGTQIGLITPDEWRIIQAALERAKTYPRMARERGIEGVVQVRFKVLSSGQVERVEIMQSSGSGILDSASIRTVYRSGPLPRVQGWVEVPISYVLK